MTERDTCWCGATAAVDHASGCLTRPDGVRVSFSVVRCAACGTGRTVPPPVADYSATPMAGNDRARQLPLWRLFAAESLALVQRYCPQGRLLDVGCNIGVLVDAAARAGYAASGIDPDQTAVAYGCQQFGVALSTQATAALPAAVYDVVMLEQTLEHVMEPVLLLRELSRLLSPGGIIAVSVPRYQGLVPRLTGAAWYGWWPWEHRWHFSDAGLRLAAVRAGLTVAGLHRCRLYHEPVWRTRPGVLTGIADAAAAIVPMLGDKVFMVVRKEE